MTAQFRIALPTLVRLKNPGFATVLIYIVMRCVRNAPLFNGVLGFFFFFFGWSRNGSYHFFKYVYLSRYWKQIKIIDCNKLLFDRSVYNLFKLKGTQSKNTKIIGYNFRTNSGSGLIISVGFYWGGDTFSFITYIYLTRIKLTLKIYTCL